jgi:hypothetical protein
MLNPQPYLDHSQVAAPMDGNYSEGPVYDISRWLVLGFAVRLLLMLIIHFSGAEKSMSLTRDAFLYDRVGAEIAQYYVSGGIESWPDRVTGVVDFGWEHFIGLVYYFFGHDQLYIKMVCVIIGSLVPFVHYRMTKIVTNDSTIAYTALILSIFFPTQVYYSTLMVRDAISSFAVSLIFLGLAEYIRQASAGWWLKVGLGFLIMLGLRSYLATMLVLIVPASFLITALVSSGGRGRALAGMMTLGIATAGIVFVAPQLIGEVDTQFTDLDYINKVRTKMNRGSGAMFDGSVTTVGSDLVETAISFAVGLYFFFFSVNPTQLGSVRQIIALPEVLLVVFGTFYSFKGGVVLWKERRDIILPLLIPTLIMTLGYSAATTNGGPLMRWRMQLIGVYLILGATGFITSRRRGSVAYEQNSVSSQGGLL